jgi:hypothetical protein
MRTNHRVFLRGAAVMLVVLAASCSSPAEGPTIEIKDGSWTAVPATMEAGGGSFELTVSNLGTTRQEFAVVSLFSGDPYALPIRSGQLDLRHHQGLVNLENPESATYYVVHPDYERREGEGSEVDPGTLVPDTIEPGEEKTVTIGGFKGGGEPGTYVVLSYTQGRYEAGDYAAFTITDPDG